MFITLPSCGSTVTGLHYCRPHFQCVRIPPKLPLGRYIQSLLFCLVIFNQRKSLWFGTNSNLLKQNLNIFSLLKYFICFGTSLVAQRLRIRLPMQRAWVWTLVWKDPTCCGATKPVCHNYWACALRACQPQLLSPHATTTEDSTPRARAPQEKPLQWEAHTPQWRVAPARRNYRKPVHSNEDPTQPNINK